MTFAYLNAPYNGRLQRWAAKRTVDCGHVMCYYRMCTSNAATESRHILRPRHITETQQDKNDCNSVRVR